MYETRMLRGMLVTAFSGPFANYIGRGSGIDDVRQLSVPRLPNPILYPVAGDTVEVVVFDTSRGPNDMA